MRVDSVELIARTTARATVVRTVVVSAALLAAGASAGMSQEVRGRALSPESTAPVTGVTVLLLDSTGHAVARTLTRGEGNYRLQAPAAGTYSLKALRIGFQPTVSNPFVLQRGIVSDQNLTLRGAVIQLTGVTTSEGRRCAPARDVVEGGFLPWDEARKALEMAILSRATPFDVELVRRERRLRAPDSTLVSESETVKRGISLHPFTSASPALLDSAGYVQADADGVTFHAPDEAVLLSPAFATTHCLHPTAAGPGEIAIGFEPTPDRTLPDLMGTITLAQSTGALRRVEFQYVNPPSGAYTDGARGTLEFMALPSGEWIVRTWALVVPLYARVTRQQVGQLSELNSGVRRVQSVEAYQYQETSGELLSLTLRGTPVWQVPIPDLRSVLVSQDGTAWRGGSVSIPMLDRQAAVDSLGTFVLHRVRPGPHQMRVVLPFLDSLGLAPLERAVVLTPDSVVTISLPSRETLFASACDDPAVVRPGYAGVLVRGVTRDANGGRVPGVTVRAEWFQPNDGNAMTTSVGALRRLTTVSSAAGDYALCGIARDQLVHLTTEIRAKPVGRHDLRVPKQAVVILDDLLADPVAAAPSTPPETK